MSPGEAAVHAARTGQVLWLEKLLPRIQSNKVEIAQDLIETGATNGDCRVIDMAYNWQTRPYQFVGQRKYVPIMLAVRGGHLDAVKCLEPRCWDVTDALHLALETKQEEMVRVLYRKANRTEFHLGAQMGYLEMVELLYSKMNSLFVYKALASAASFGRLNVVKFLFERHGWREFAGLKCLMYTSPIRVAAQRGHLEIVKFLFDRGGFMGRSELKDALRVSAVRGHLEVLQFLFENGVTTRAVLTCAYLDVASNGRLDVMKVLFRMGAWHPRLLETALVRAAACHEPKVVKFLLDHGADRTVLDEVLRKAVTKGDMKTVNVLYSVEGKSQPRLYGDAFVNAAATGCLRIVKCLFEGGVNKNAVLNAALVQAAAAGKLRIVSFLIGTSKISRHDILADAFKRAAANGHVKVLAFLHKRGVDQMPLLHCAFQKAAEHGHRKAVEFLYSHGVRNTAVLSSSLVKAVNGMHFEVVEFLFQRGG